MLAAISALAIISPSIAAPSSTALAASLTSARVGRGSVRIESNTCVATMTGIPNSRPLRNTCFCTSMGTGPKIQAGYDLARGPAPGDVTPGCGGTGCILATTTGALTVRSPAAGVGRCGGRSTAATRMRPEAFALRPPSRPGRAAPR